MSRLTGASPLFSQWPFVRWLGMQEPASAIFSLMNLMCHMVMLRRFMTLVPQHAPLYWLWITYARVSFSSQLMVAYKLFVCLFFW